MASELSEMAEAMATRESRENKLNAVLKIHDRNKDGVLTEEEFNINQVLREEL